jgi:hypothetical protein
MNFCVSLIECSFWVKIFKISKIVFSLKPMIHGIGISEYLKIAEKTAYHFALGKKSLVLRLVVLGGFVNLKLMLG